MSPFPPRRAEGQGHAIRDQFAADVPHTVTDLTAATQRPIAEAALAKPATAAAWRAIPPGASSPPPTATSPGRTAFHVRTRPAHTIEVDASRAGARTARSVTDALTERG